MDHKITIRVATFGEFSMSCTVNGKEYVLTESYSTSKRFWTFLQYMSVFHYRDIDQKEMLDVLWHNNESVNPGNALKTTLFRARAAMEELGLADGKEVILYKHGVYHWNPSIHLELDTKEFDALYPNFVPDFDSALKAIALYKGDFLAGCEDPWVISIRTFYQTKFVNLSGETAALLNSAGQHKEAMALCQRAIELDPFNEKCHLELMLAMSAVGLTKEALQHYSYITKLFMNQLGVLPSPEMTALYRRLNSSGISMEMDLNIIRDRLTELKGGGAFFCDHDVFQEIYRLEARRAVRSGTIVQLALITILDQNGEPLQTRRCSSAMDELKSVLHKSLRSGDIFAQHSPAQYLLLLPTANHENSLMILKRIQTNFGKTLVGMTTVLEHSVLPVLPVNDDANSLF